MAIRRIGKDYQLGDTTVKETVGGGDGGNGLSVDGTALPFDPGPFPEWPGVEFDPIKVAKYKATDPLKFAQAFGNFNRGEIDKNYQQGSRIGLDAINTELKALQAFAPAASALSREQTSIDNQFNQQNRTNQVNSVLPGARRKYDRLGRTLDAQGRRADTYASGRLTDSALDRSFELGIRSNAADAAGFGGIGSHSLQAEKISDLMSAEQRFGISQYGEGLINQNVNAQEQLTREEANLFLAPTAYSNVGSQIGPKPEVGAGRLALQATGMVNEATLLSPGQALNTEVQQSQFKTSLDQRTNEFNATGKFSASQINAQGIFNSAVGGFTANAQFQSQQQAANQSILNGRQAAGLAEIGMDAFQGGVDTAQQAQQIQSTAAAIGTITGAMGGATNLVGQDLSNGQSVGGTNVSTEPTQTSAAPLTDTSLTSGPNAAPSGLSYSGAGGSPDGSSPSGYKFMSGTPAPSGYTPVLNNSDGTYSAVRASDYNDELDRFQKVSGSNSSGDTSGALRAIAQADRGITEAAGLSYVPVQGFQQISTLNSGRPVYSLPSAAKDGNLGAGAGVIEATGLAINQLGVSDPAIYSELIGTGTTLANPDTYSRLDQVYGQSGESGVTNEILSTLGVPTSNQSTPASQRVTAGAMRIGELWPSLSPAQRSQALSSLTPSVVEAKTGKSISKQVVPGSEKSIAGPLTVGKAMEITSEGRNGFALARNWQQLSAMGDVLGTKDAKAIANVADATGFLGYGPQGAAVSVPPEYLSKVGATPAPSLGVGAMVFAKAQHVPKNYSVVSQSPDGGVIALPSNLKHTSPVDAKNPSPLSYRNADTVARGLHPVQKLWGKAPTRNIVRGAVGGSAIVSGMNIANSANPAMMGSLVAHSLFNRTMGGYGVLPAEVPAGVDVDAAMNAIAYPKGKNG